MNSISTGERKAVLEKDDEWRDETEWDDILQQLVKGEESLKNVRNEMWLNDN